MPPFLTCLFCLRKNGRVKKIIGFLKPKSTFCLVGPRGEWGCGSQKGIYDEPPTLGIPRQHVVSMMALFRRLVFRGAVPL